jgi:hypothetical protein
MAYHYSDVSRESDPHALRTTNQTSRHPDDVRASCEAARQAWKDAEHAVDVAGWELDRITGWTEREMASKRQALRDAEAAESKAWDEYQQAEEEAWALDGAPLGAGQTRKEAFLLED